MYIVVEKTYLMTDMIDFDGENVEEWINADLRKIAIEEGYSINASEMDEVNADWGDKLQMVVTMDTQADGITVYKAALRSPASLTRSDGIPLINEYAR